MRQSQPFGLPNNALEFLFDNAVRIDVCKHCKRHGGYKKEKIGTYGMFDEIDLYRYTLLSGETADEYIQREVWSSGPMIWLGLTWKGTEFKWQDSEMMDD